MGAVRASGAPDGNQSSWAARSDSRDVFVKSRLRASSTKKTRQNAKHIVSFNTKKHNTLATSPVYSLENGLICNIYEYARSGAVVEDAAGRKTTCPI